MHVHSLVTEQSLLIRSTEFEADIQDGDKISLRALCDKKSKESLYASSLLICRAVKFTWLFILCCTCVGRSEEERETWAFLKVMLAEEGTARTYLLALLGFNTLEETTRHSTNELGRTFSDTLNIDNGLFTGSTDARSLFDNGDDFFNNLQFSQKNLSEEPKKIRQVLSRHCRKLLKNLRHLIHQ